MENKREADSLRSPLKLRDHAQTAGTRARRSNFIAINNQALVGAISQERSRSCARSALFSAFGVAPIFLATSTTHSARNCTMVEAAALCAERCCAKCARRVELCERRITFPKRVPCAFDALV